jgi:anti-sigma factor RsiW
MNCREALQHMQEFVDDELDAALHQEFILHARACATCQATLKEQQRLIRRLTDTFQHQAQAPATLVSGVFRCIFQKRRKYGSILSFLKIRRK